MNNSATFNPQAAARVVDIVRHIQETKDKALRAAGNVLKPVGTVLDAIPPSVDIIPSPIDNMAFMGLAGINKGIKSLNKVDDVGRGVVGAVKAVDNLPINKVDDMIRNTPQQLESGIANLVKAVRELPRYEYTPQKGLSEGEQLIESKFGTYIKNNVKMLSKKYDELFGHIGNTDNVREFSEDYAKSKETLSRAVHEPSSGLMNYKNKYEILPNKDIKTIVRTAGGTGSGKTTAAINTHGVIGDSEYMWDSNLSNYDSAIKKIDADLANGKMEEIYYILTDPVDAFGRAIKRSIRIGRTVPLNEHVNTHVGANEVIKKLAVRYKDNPNVKIIYLDNRGTRASVKEITLDEINKISYNKKNLYNELNSLLDNAYAKGQIPTKIYQGFKTSVLPK